MNPNIEILPMTKTSAEEAAALEKICFSSPWSADSLIEASGRADSSFLTAFVDGKFAGYAGMLCVLDEGQICNVAVCPAFRRMGVGEALMAAQREIALSRGITVMMLEVRASNTAAQCLYEKLGWEKLGTRKNFYSSPREDALLYNLYL
ncbi:MAG: ribosomal protein S18-alanine N-acetyltransferase [Clostridia bacterium]|nr:ribosomal protein S18-alanine N-acetyltransferase [Clostridia bacterium]